MKKTGALPTTEPWFQDSQSFLHDQYQTIRDLYLECSQVNEQRLQVFFTLLVAASGVVAVLPTNNAWLAVVLPAGLFTMGLYTFANVTYYGWYREWLAGQLDLMALRWTSSVERPEGHFLLLQTLWQEAQRKGRLTHESQETKSAARLRLPYNASDGGDKGTPKSKRQIVGRLIRHTFSLQEYRSFIRGVPHIALVAAINCVLVSLLAWVTLSAVFLLPYAIGCTLVLATLMWIAQTLYYRMGAIYRVEESLKMQFHQLNTSHSVVVSE